MGNKPKSNIREHVIIEFTMIGQKNLIETLMNLGSNLPRFFILTGDKGSGKKSICKLLAKKLKYSLVFSGIKMENVRSTIDLAYTQREPVIYVLADADNMNINAKNVLLKITEEPPKNSYFIMTLENIDNTLETIKSRAAIFKLDNYSYEELVEFRKYRGYSDSYDDIIKQVCTVTGDIDELFSYDIEKFYNLINTIATKIQDAPCGNTLKISKMLKLKDGEEGYSPYLFFNSLRNLFFKLGRETNDVKYLKAAIETSNFLTKLRNTTVSRLGLCDMWIMNIRGVLKCN